MSEPVQGEGQTPSIPMPAYSGQPGGGFGQHPGYGYPMQGYGPRPKKPYAGALIVAAIGFVVEAIASFLYFPTDQYSMNMQRIADVTSGLGYLLIAVAALIAVATSARK